MYTIRARNVNDALPTALQMLASSGVFKPSRYGDTLEIPGPVCTTYTAPRERVLWHPERDANPFFHFFEALWILAGRKDVGFLVRFNKRMAEFSDDGHVFHAPYGHRLRHHFGGDQITSAVAMLEKDPTSRRVVLQIWDPVDDMGMQSKDLPCNDTIFLKTRAPAGGVRQLDMTVCCRSNDAVWGCYGANVVQFSMLQEYIAAKLNLAVGEYHQISDSFHVYTSNPYWMAYQEQPKVGGRLARWYMPDAYESMGVRPYPLFAQPQAFDDDLTLFFAAYDNGTDPRLLQYGSTTFTNVVMPLYYAHTHHKNNQPLEALGAASLCHAEDWRMACAQWLDRRNQRIINAALELDQ